MGDVLMFIEEEEEEEEGLFSPAALEAGLLRFPNNNYNKKKKGDHHRCMNGFFSLLLPSPPAAASTNLPIRPDLFRGAYYDQHDQPCYFLDACFLCKKSLHQAMDIFMYRGDTPFCSEECRQQQIDMDEAMERNRILSLNPAPSSFNLSTYKDKFRDFLQRVGSIIAW